MDDVIVKLLTLLNQLVEERGVPESNGVVDKNIIKSPNSPLSNKKSGLSSKDKKDVKEIAGIFAKEYIKALNSNKKPTLSDSYKLLTGDKKVSKKTPTVKEKPLASPVAKKTPTVKEKPDEHKKKTNHFIREFFNYWRNDKKRDKQDKTLISSSKKLTTAQKPLQSLKKDGGKLSGWLLLLMGAIGALVYGLLTDGPLKGTMKILAKLGMSILKTWGKRIITAAWRVISAPFKAIFNIAKNILKPFMGAVTAPFKKLGGKLGGGMIGRMLKFVKPLLKGLKKVPVIGNLISIGFAVSRFMGGDIVGGVIDTLSALSGLLNLIPGGTLVAIPLGIGLDVLNAWLDAKTAGSKDKNAAKLDILKDMAGAVGNHLKKVALYLPLVGTFMRFGRAWEHSKSGNLKDALSEFRLGLFTLIPGGGAIIAGIDMLNGMFGGEKKEEAPSPVSGDTFVGKIKKFLKSKLDSLPAILKTPLKWLGILDDDGKDAVGDIKVEDTTGGITKKLSDTASSMWDKLKTIFSFDGEALKDGAKSFYDSLKNNTSKLWDKLKTSFNISPEKIMNKSKEIYGGIKSYSSKLWGGFTDITSKIYKNIKDSTSSLSSSPKPKPIQNEKIIDTSKNILTQKPDISPPKFEENIPSKIAETPSSELKGMSISKISVKKLSVLCDISKAQLFTMQKLERFSEASLEELRRISNEKSNQTVQIKNSQSSPNVNYPMNTFENNRSGYTSSPYALT